MLRRPSHGTVALDWATQCSRSTVRLCPSGAGKAWATSMQSGPSSRRPKGVGTLTEPCLCKGSACGPWEAPREARTCKSIWPSASSESASGRLGGTRAAISALAGTAVRTAAAGEASMLRKWPGKPGAGTSTVFSAEPRHELAKTASFSRAIGVATYIRPAGKWASLAIVACRFAIPGVACTPVLARTSP